MSRLCQTLLALTLVGAFAMTAMAAPSGPGLIYSGRLLDEHNAPVSGVFPLRFALHKTEKTRKRLWWEEHWVAVEEGIYTVELGTTKAIPEGLDLASLYIGVSVDGGGEIVRERLSERNLPAGATAPTTVVVSHPGAARGSGPADYAEKAGLAYEAEHSRNSDRIGNLTLEQLDERYSRKKSGARVGPARRYSGQVGGEGGRPYQLICPKGYVAVGVRGGAGIYLDSIEVICAPLE